MSSGPGAGSMERMRYAYSSLGFAALIALCACSGLGSQSSRVLPQSAAAGGGTFASTAVSAVALPATQVVGSGEIFGTDNMFTPNDGDTATGGHGKQVDNVLCNRNSAIYHVHFFIGIIVNGQHRALPDGTGMSAPSADFTLEPEGFKNWTETSGCYYYLHTHDASGVVHVESPANEPKSAWETVTLYTLGTYFDVWGTSLSSTNIGSINGTVTAYVAQPHVLKTDPVPNTMLVRFTGNPRTIPIHSHTVVWLEIGSPTIAPSSLSTIKFYEEY